MIRGLCLSLLVVLLSGCEWNPGQAVDAIGGRFSNRDGVGKPAQSFAFDTFNGEAVSLDQVNYLAIAVEQGGCGTDQLQLELGMVLDRAHRRLD